MNQLLPKTALPYLLAAAPLLALSSLGVACSGTETDNPFLSPILFEPAPPAPPGCPPLDDDGPPRDLPLWGRSGNYLVGVDAVGSVPRRGLVVLDVSDPAAPRVVAEVPLAGYPRQLLVQEGSATLVIDELERFDAPPVPAPAELAQRTKLVRFDLSSPSSPQRLADVVLGGEFWQVQPDADGYWVLSGNIDAETQRCDVPRNLCGYVSRDAIVLTHYTWSGSAWTAGQSLELPAGPRVWLTEAGFATATSVPGTAGVLSYAAFAADGSLGPKRTLPLPDGIVAYSPLYFDAEHAGVFVYDLTDGSAAFVLFALDGTELGRVSGLSQGLGQAGTVFFPGGALVASGSSNDAAAYLDFRDPGALRRVSLPRASAFLPLAAPGAIATRALGWKAEPSGNATTFTLWDLTTSPPTLLDSLPTTLAAPQQASELQLSGDSVVFSLRGPDNAPLTGSLRWAGDALTLAGPIAGGYGDQVVAVDDWLYQPDALGLAFANPGQGVAQREAWDEGSLLDVSAVPGGEARLALDYQSGMKLFVTRAGTTRSIAVSPGAQQLLPAGDRIIVLSTQPEDQCEQSGLDCIGYAPNAAIVELSSLRVVAELPLPELPVPQLSEQSRVEQSWAYSADATQSPVRLGEQKWLLENEYSATCLSEADCAALGIVPVPIGQANVLVGQQACAPGAKTCPQPPAPSVYGEARRRVSYVLDAAAASLSDPLIVERERGTPYNAWARPIYSRNTLLDLHLEPSSFPKPGSPPPTSSAFLLERYVLNAAGSLEALPEINIPGYPVALLSDSELLTLEPGPALAGNAQLHRVRIGGTGASVRATRALQARVGSVKVIGQTAVYVREPADSCEPTTHIETYALDGQLTPVASLELAGDGWQPIEPSLRAADDNSLLLQREHAFVRVEIDAQGNASVAGFETAPTAVYGVDADAGVVRAISGNRVIRLEP